MGQDTGGRKRGIAVVLSDHCDETFTVETESEVLTLRLERKRGRFCDSQPQVRYRFALIARATTSDEERVLPSSIAKE